MTIELKSKLDDYIVIIIAIAITIGISIMVYGNYRQNSDYKLVGLAVAIASAGLYGLYTIYKDSKYRVNNGVMNMFKNIRLAVILQESEETDYDRKLRRYVKDNKVKLISGHLNKEEPIKNLRFTKDSVVYETETSSGRIPKSKFIRIINDKVKEGELKEMPKLAPDE